MKELVIPTLVIAAVATVSAVTDKTELYSYQLNDGASNNNYDEGTKEYHCFDVVGGVKTYVRGTYGNFGYFEGSVDPNDSQTFHINWYESASADLSAVTGAATIVYDNTFANVGGTYWNTGRNDITDSFAEWDSSLGSKIADDTTTAGSDTLLQKCLYPGLNYVSARISVDTKFISASSEQGTNAFCQIPAGGVGSFLGAYDYVYPETDPKPGTEEGTYGVNPYGFWASKGFGFVGTWNALKGPYKGDSGSTIYMVVKTATKSLVVGYYCSVDADKKRTDCFSESYAINSKDTGLCPQYYANGDSLVPLYEFSEEGVDVHEGSDDAYCFHVETEIDYKGVKYSYEELKAGKEPECTVPHSPISKGLVITTSCGKTVRVTDTHLVATTKGFQLAYSLRPGDVLFGDYEREMCAVKSVEKENSSQQYFGLNCIHSEVLASGLRTSTFGDFHTLPSWYMSYVGGLLGTEAASSLGESIAEWYFKK